MLESCSMEVHRSPSVEGFLSEVGDFLSLREAEHSLLFGICSGLARDGLELENGAPYMVHVEDKGRIVAAAVRTPPHGLVLSLVDEPTALELIAADAKSVYGRLPGVLGPKEAVPWFALVWEKLSGQKGRLLRHERIFQCDSVVSPPQVPGCMREAQEDESNLLVEWTVAFQADALREEPEHALKAESAVAHRVRDPSGGFCVWDDDSVVSMAGYGGRTPRGIRIAPVYTPPHRRRRGYASALVAELTQQLLDGGRSYCFLFTDLSNPISNRIYGRVGYRAVSDVDEYAFVEA